MVDGEGASFSLWGLLRETQILLPLAFLRYSQGRHVEAGPAQADELS